MVAVRFAAFLWLLVEVPELGAGGGVGGDVDGVVVEP
jgi:hypothetical protein